MVAHRSRSQKVTGYNQILLVTLSCQYLTLEAITKQIAQKAPIKKDIDCVITEGDILAIFSSKKKGSRLIRYFFPVMKVQSLMEN